MKAIQFLAAGGPEVVRYREVPKPAPLRGRVLVRVRATCANPADWKIREGASLALQGLEYPMIPGWDASGIVESVGGGVSGVAVGDEVVGVLPVCGSYAEYALLAPDAMTAKPPELSHIEAAALAAAAVTAWSGLFHCGDLRPGQRVLIHAAAGGVGHLAVQMARNRGACVIATASAENHAFVREMGADEVIDYRAQPFEELVAPVDLVLDLVGGDVEQRSWQVLKPGGLLVSAIRPIPDDAIPPGKRGTVVRTAATSEDLAMIMTLAARGELKVKVRAVFPLSRAGEALEVSRQGHGQGRIVIAVDDPQSP